MSRQQQQLASALPINSYCCCCFTYLFDELHLWPCAAVCKQLSIAAQLAGERSINRERASRLSDDIISERACRDSQESTGEDQAAAAAATTTGAIGDYYLGEDYCHCHKHFKDELWLNWAKQHSRQTFASFAFYLNAKFSVMGNGTVVGEPAQVVRVLLLLLLLIVTAAAETFLQMMMMMIRMMVMRWTCDDHTHTHSWLTRPSHQRVLWSCALSEDG